MSGNMIWNAGVEAVVENWLVSEIVSSCLAEKKISELEMWEEIY